MVFPSGKIAEVAAPHCKGVEDLRPTLQRPVLPAGCVLNICVSKMNFVPSLLVNVNFFEGTSYVNVFPPSDASVYILDPFMVEKSMFFSPITTL
jgi:hypothetical protein